MLGSKLTDTQNNSLNIEAISIHIYKDYFIAEATLKSTAITTRIRIDRKTHDILQLDNQQSAKLMPQRTFKCSALLGILPILNKHFLLVVQLCKIVCVIDEHNIYEIQQVALIPFEQEQELDRDISGNLTDKSLKSSQQNVKVIAYVTYLKTYLLTEGYYFSFKYDLSLSRSAHALGYPSKKKFLWNFNVAKHLQKLNDRRWFVRLIQGSIRNFKITLNGNVFQYTLITRRSWTKGGTRFNSRGIDLKGNVANFCQTEQLIFYRNHCYSHLQIRGSVPLFWKQTGLYGQVQFYKTKQQNQQSFQKHLKKMIKNYNRLFCINLLCKQKEGEIDLILYFEKLIKQTAIKEVKYQYFDVHCASKGQRFERCNYLIDKIAGVNKFFTYYKEIPDKKMVQKIQQGIIRVNCLDNLDRTNLIQTRIAYDVLNNIFHQLQLDLNATVNSSSIVTAADDVNNNSLLIIHLKNAWADNGDMISKHYTGTGSTHTNVTRTGKRDIKGLMDHGFKTCKRLYQQYVDDNQKQEVIDILLGEHTQTVNLSEIQARLKTIDQEQTSDPMTSSLIQNW